MRCILLFLALAAASKCSYSQSSASASADTSKANPRTLTVGTTFGNNMYYYGQSLSSRVPYGTLNLSLSDTSGLWAGASLVKMIGSMIPSGFSETDLSIGYDFTVMKKIDASLSYTRFIFPKDSPLPQSVNPNTLSFGLSNTSKLFRLSLYNDFVFGKQQSDFFLTFTGSKEVDLCSINKNKDYISIGPSFNITGGTQHLADTVTSGNNAGPLDNLRGKRARKLLPPLSSGQSQASVVNSTKFSYLATTLKLPVSYNRAHYSIETAYQISFLNKDFNENPQSFFTLSFNYYFFKD